METNTKTLQATLQQAVSTANILKRESTDPRVKSLAQVFLLLHELTLSMERELAAASEVIEEARKLAENVDRASVAKGLNTLSGAV